MIDPQKELGSPSFTLPKESTPEAPSFVIETLSTTEVVEPQKEQEFPETPPRVDTPSVESDSSTLDVLRKTLRRSKKKKPTTIPQIRDEITVQVEKIMEDGLKDAFMEMTPVQQQEFKIKGEETAQELRRMLQSTKIKAKKVVLLLIDWLKLLPGVNKFFIEQEAKIKADKIVSLHHHLPPRT